MLASLGALETLRAGEPARPFTASAGDLELLLRIAGHAGGARPTLGKRGLVTAGGAADALVAEVTQTILGRVRAGIAVQNAHPGGTHSSAVVVVDADGNIVVGTHTIEALNWERGSSSAVFRSRRRRRLPSTTPRRRRSPSGPIR